MRPALFSLIVLAFCAAAASAVAQEAEAKPPAKAPAAKECYSAAEAREKIASAKLAEPFALLRAEAGERHAEAIAVKLCREATNLVYEIDLLRHDGRLIHTKLDAVTGKALVEQRP